MASGAGDGKEELVIEIASQCMSKVKRKGTSKLWTTGEGSFLSVFFPTTFLTKLVVKVLFIMEFRFNKSDSLALKLPSS